MINCVEDLRKGILHLIVDAINKSLKVGSFENLDLKDDYSKI